MSRKPRLRIRRAPSGRTALLFLVLVVTLMPGRPVRAQQAAAQPTVTLALRGLSLGDALDLLVQHAEIDLVYESQLVSGRHVYCALREAPAEAFLRCILESAGLDYIRSSSGAYVLIEPIRIPSLYSNLAGRVVDLETGTPLPFANVLLADASTGTTTNEEGLFNFASLMSGWHRVVVTYVGYQTRTDSVWISGRRSERFQIALAPTPVALDPIVIDGITQRLPSGGLGRDMMRAEAGRAIAFGVGGFDIARGAASLPGVSAAQPLADLHIQGSENGAHLTLLDGAPVRDPVSLGRHLSAFSPLALSRLTVHKAGYGAELPSHLAGLVAVEHALPEATTPAAAVSLDASSLNALVSAGFDLPAGRSIALLAALRTSTWSMYPYPIMEELLEDWNQADPLLMDSWLNKKADLGTLDRLSQHPDLRFSDLHLVTRARLSSFGTLYTSLYRAGNSIGTDLLSTAVANAERPDPHALILTEDDYNWENWAGQSRYTWLLGARSILSVQAVGSYHASSYLYRGKPLWTASLQPDSLSLAVRALRDSLQADPGSEEKHSIRELTLRTTLNHSFAPDRHLDLSLEASQIDATFRAGNGFLVPFAHDTGTWEVAAHSTLSFALGLGASLEPGLRLTYLTARRTVYAEPRLALRYDHDTERPGGYAVRLAAGLYRQYTMQYELTSSGSTAVVPSMQFWLPLDRSLAPPLAYHLAAEFLWLPHRDWTVRLESYYKGQPRLLVLDYPALINPPYTPPEGSSEASTPNDGPYDHDEASDDEAPVYEPYGPVDYEVLPDQDAFVAAGDGYAYGAGVRIQRDGERLHGTLTYSYSRSFRHFPGRFDDRTVPAPWNEPHRLQADLDVEVVPHLTLALGWRGIWDRRWAFRRAYYDYLALRSPSEVFDFNDPAADVLPAFTQFDAGLTYERTWGGVRIRTQISLINVLDQRNVYDQSLDEAGTRRVDRYLPGRQPTFLMHVVF